jgi:pyruvate formate lyase activating enzyme
MNQNTVSVERSDKVGGLIFDIVRFSIHDGPGIRTTVFFKGCHLACQWCHNPESRCAESELVLNPGKCCRCGSCEKVCPLGKISIGEIISVKELPCLEGCRLCVIQCPTKALEMIGKVYTADELCSILTRDRQFYQISGGGVTLSGGEPLIQIDFVSAILKLLKQQRIHTVIETSGYVDWKNIESILSYVDFIYYDVKFVSDYLHKKYTLHSNFLIKENLKRLYSVFKNIKVRIPLIPQITDTDENLESIATFLADQFSSSIEVELLPYNSLGEAKRQHLVISGLHRMPIQPKNIQTSEQLQRAIDIFLKHRIRVTLL